jgi:hypothetical protein
VEQLKRRRPPLSSLAKLPSPGLPSPPFYFRCVWSWSVVCGLWSVVSRRLWSTGITKYSIIPLSLLRLPRVTPSRTLPVPTTVATTVVYRKVHHPPKQATSNNHRLSSFTSAIPRLTPQRHPRNDTNDAATTPNTTILGSTHPRCNCCTRHGSPWLFRAEVVRNSSRSLTRKSLWVSAVACRLVGPPVPSDSRVSRTSETLGMRMAL